MSDLDQYNFFQNQINGKVNQIYDYAPVIDSTGDFQRISGIDVVILSIRTLLLTPLGHYPFDPTYGSLLFKKLFEMADRITQDEIEYEVTERIEQFEDRVTITNVKSNYSSDGKTVIIHVDIERDGITGLVSVTFNGNDRMFGLEDDISAGLK